MTKCTGHNKHGAPRKRHHWLIGVMRSSRLRKRADRCHACGLVCVYSSYWAGDRGERLLGEFSQDVSFAEVYEAVHGAAPRPGSAHHV